MAELEAMQPRFSQYLPGEEIPEKHWMYRLAKKYWFNDFAAYGRLEPGVEKKISGLLKTKLETKQSEAESPKECVEV